MGRRLMLMLMILLGCTRGGIYRRSRSSQRRPRELRGDLDLT
jgi:hypothetical protein